MQSSLQMVKHGKSYSLPDLLLTKVPVMAIPTRRFVFKIALWKSGNNKATVHY